MKPFYNFVTNTRAEITLANTFTSKAHTVVNSLKLSAFVTAAMFSGNSPAFSQTTQLEHSSPSYAGSIPSGPSVASVKARFVNNTSGNTFVEFNPEINVTASFSDQQFTDCDGGPNLKGNFFGGTSNDDRKSVIAQPVWRILNSISNPSNNLFTSNPTGTAGQGIDVDVNHGFNIFSTVEPLQSSKKSTGGRYYYSKLTLTFNRPVSNPVLHIVGLGAWTKVDNDQLGYATELELENTNGITLSKLSGSAALSVENNKILNNKGTINSESSSGAASGSIRVTGNNITTLVFKIYLRGDGKGKNWTADKLFSGDQWVMAFSMNASIISGNVFDDGNGLTDNKVNGNPTNLENKLHINLINSNNDIVATTDVAEDGGYVFQDVVHGSFPATFNLVLSTDPASKTGSLTDGWVFTGENIGLPTANGNDNNVDGILTTVTLNNSTTSVSNANFGINKIPMSADKNADSQTNPGGNNQVTVPTLTGSDFEDGNYNGSGNTIKVTNLPEDKGDLYYDGSKVTLNQVITNYDPSKLKADPTDGAQTLTFTYSHIDAAGSSSAPATVKMPFTVAGYMISGNVFDDANGLLGNSPNDNKVDGNAVNGSDIDNADSGKQSVFVSLIQGGNITTTTVHANGTYSFSNVAVGSYTVVLSKNSQGSTSGSLPDLWVNTGENQGTSQGNDGNTDGILSLTVNDQNVTDLNFGIDKTPSADSKSRSITAPGANSFLSLDGKSAAPALSGNDPEDGNLGGAGSIVVITSFPENGKLFYGPNGNEVEITTLNSIFTNNFEPSNLKVQFIGTGYKNVNFEYAFVDAAGKQGTSNTYELKWESSLPVTLVKFITVKQEQTVVLKWSTTAETNSDRFEIEHSVKGKEWSTAGSVQSKGESSVLVSYSFTHLDPSAGENLYRLKMIDNDATFAYSSVNSVNFEMGTEIAAYPNPAVNFVKLKVDGQNDWSKIKDIRMYNMSGAVVVPEKLTSNEIDVTKLMSGFYVLQVTRVNGMVSTSKIVIKK